MRLPIEHRAAARYETVNKETSVQLMDWTDRQITGAKLINISETGPPNCHRRGAHVESAGLGAG